MCVYSIVLTTSPERSSLTTTLSVFAMASNAKDSATELDARVGCVLDGAAGVEVWAIDVTPLITESSRCAGMVVMGDRCDIRFSVALTPELSTRIRARLVTCPSCAER